MDLSEMSHVTPAALSDSTTARTAPMAAVGAAPADGRISSATSARRRSIPINAIASRAEPIAAT